jgi:hypothetical protein
MRRVARLYFAVLGTLYGARKLGNIEKSVIDLGFVRIIFSRDWYQER